MADQQAAGRGRRAARASNALVAVTEFYSTELAALLVEGEQADAIIAALKKQREIDAEREAHTKRDLSASLARAEKVLRDFLGVVEMWAEAREKAGWGLDDTALPERTLREEFRKLAADYLPDVEPR